MPLTLVTGKANAGKTGIIYEQVRSALGTGRRPVLIVPSEPDAERARAELARDFPVGTRVLTFDRFVSNAWDEIGDGREIVTASRRSLLCACAARRCGQTSGVGQLAEECVVLLAERTGKGWRSGTISTVPNVGAGLASVISAYAEMLEDLQLIEPAEASHLLPELGPDYAAPLLLHRFTDFTLSQEALVRAWAAKGEAWVSLTWRDGFAPTLASDELRSRLRPDEDHVVDEQYAADETVAALSDALFDRPAALVAGASVRFSLAEGGEAEAVRIAEEVTTALLEETASTESEIAVVFRNVEAHYPALRQAFAEAGISADFDVRVPFSRVPFGAAVGHAIAYAMRGDRARLLALMRSSFAGIDGEEAKRLEREWRRNDISSRDALMRGVRGASPGVAGVLERLVDAAARQLDATSAQSVSTAIRQLFVLGYGRDGMPPGTRQEMDAWAHRAAMSMLSDVARLVPGSVGLSDVGDALAAQSVGPRETERPGHVQVTSAARVRGRRFETVILGGLNTGEFPASTSETLLPGSAAEAVLAAFGGAGESSGGMANERLVFYLVVSRARKRLVLSAQTTDSDGEPRGISPFFEVACDSFRGGDEDDGWPPHTYRSLSETPKTGVGTGQRERNRAMAYAGETDSPRLASAARRARVRQPGLEGARGRSRLAAREVFSASELETYLDCPYKWFYGYAVRAADELERRFGAAEQGKFAHELLHRVYGQLFEWGVPRVSAQTLGTAREALDSAFRLVSEEAGPARSVEERVARAGARRWADRILGDDSYLLPGFRPAYLEWAFGFETPVQIGSYALRGRVDRIDVDQSGRAIVTDYKSSEGFTAADIVSKGKVQIPLYLKAMEQELGLKPAGGLYRTLRKRHDRGIVSSDAVDGGLCGNDIKPPEEFEETLAAGLAIAEEAVAGIREACIECAPRTKESCKYCKAALFCGVSR